MEACDQGHQQSPAWHSGQVVWAKITGYPWWPAIIKITPQQTSGNYRVDFIGDTSHAFLPDSKLTAYQTMREEIDLHQHMPRGLRKAILTADRLTHHRPKPLPIPRLSPVRPQTPKTSLQQLLQSPSTQSKQNQTKLQNTNSQHSTLIEQQQPEQEQEEEHGQGYSLEQREEFVASLLKKYQLDEIARVSQREESQERNRVNKRKMIKKQPKVRDQQQQSLHNCRPLIAKKIHNLLKQKKPWSSNQLKNMSLSLSRQIMGRQQSQKQTLLRMLKWIDISEVGTIRQYHDNWGNYHNDKDKCSSMTAHEE